MVQFPWGKAWLRGVRILAPILGLLMAFSAAAGDIVIGTTATFHSAKLNEDRTYQVMLPASYERSPNRTYPVVYVLDGETQFQHTAADAAFLAADGQIPEVIVVGIVSTVRIRDFTQTDWAEAWEGGGGASRFRSFLADEFLPHIASTYRVSPYRALSGHSAGGQFALYVLTEDPALFQGIIAISPSLDWDHRVPLRTLQESIPKRRDIKNFVYFASSDDSGDALKDDQALAAILKGAASKGIRSIYRPYPQETHTGIALPAQADALRQLFAGYAVPDAVVSKGVADVEAYYARLSSTLGMKISVPASVRNALAFDALHAGRKKEAFVMLHAVIADDPNSPEAFDSLSEAYQSEDSLTEALEASRHARSLADKYDHDNVDYYDRQLARVLRKQKSAVGGK
ncbi:alpha/beta hydrolase [Luteibacter flocculans]|uniref:Alpha/beta hydrolase n=1 Tax=Luteibacter flocculans TaxID=2780091 RepID=A0ABY4SZL7_9GAMM|nr:alpha/beta hydrolase-fold protein [Luteibacter flocculans]URL57013.1 alpha/beta hydrolase [Luteibacter flocculans]